MFDILKYTTIMDLKLQIYTAHYSFKIVGF